MSAALIVCPHCSGVNRIPDGKSAAEANCGVCHKPLFTGHPAAAWCGPCKMMAPVYERVAAEVEPKMRFLKVDTDREQALAQRYGIRGIPTLMVFRGGKPVAQRAGAVDAASLRAWLAAVPSA